MKTGAYGYDSAEQDKRDKQIDWFIAGVIVTGYGELEVSKFEADRIRNVANRFGLSVRAAGTGEGNRLLLKVKRK
jgi:hypothetical protein